MTERDKQRLRNIRKYIELTRKDIREQHITLDSLQFNSVHQRLLAFNIDQIGENCWRLSEQFKQKHSYIKWDRIRFNRNFISHDYENFDHDACWYIVHKDFPKLEKILNQYAIKVLL
jgi:uncharacterized protein with HEPN domain